MIQILRTFFPKPNTSPSLFHFFLILTYFHYCILMYMYIVNNRKLNNLEKVN